MCLDATLHSKQKSRKSTKMVRFGFRIELRTNGDHQNDRNFDPDAMEGLPDQKNKVSEQFLKVSRAGGLY